MLDTLVPPTDTSIMFVVGVLVELALARDSGSEKFSSPTLSNFCACPETFKVRGEPFDKLKSPFVMLSATFFVY